MINIALTSGCPKGIGPEICVSAAAKLSKKFNITIYGDLKILEKAKEVRGIKQDLTIKDLPAVESMPDLLSDSDCGRYSYILLENAIYDTLNKEHDAVVTAPINKFHWRNAEIPYIGHTELFADKCHTTEYAMMFASPKLKVTLATIHIPLKEVASSLTTEKIVNVSRLTYVALKRTFNIKRPRIAIASLNPHSGENGLFGIEEKDIIAPAIVELHKRDIPVSGPYPADSIFHKAVSGEYDAVVAMYHDQALATIKTLDHKNTVNLTLGLPIIRTSVDHGTAEDIAWKGTADDTNLIAAIEMAGKMGA